MKRYKLKHPVGVGDHFLRGKITDIQPADDRHSVLTLQFKTAPDRKVLVWIN